MNTPYKIYASICFLVLVTLLDVNKVTAQCIETLRAARTVYDQGRLNELPSMLEDCLKEGFNEEEKTEAYRLLVLCYVYQDLPILADQAMLALLNANPRFQINPDVDPNELILLYKSFRTAPIFRWGFKLIGNYTMVNISKTFGVSNSLISDGKYTGNIGFAGALFIEKDFFQNRITLHAEPSYAINNMTYTGSAFAQDELSGENTATYKDIETQSWVGLNVLAKYPFLANSNIGKKINPHVILGPAAQFLLSSKSANTTGIAGGESASGADIDFIANGNRKNLNLSVVAGVGIILPIGKMSFVSDLTYQYGLVNITDKHYSSELSLRYGRGMSDQTLNTINLSMGLMFNKYKPIKLAH